MTLNDFTKVGFDEAVKGMNMVDLKVHTNDDGEVCSVEVKYCPKGEKADTSTFGKRGNF